MLLARDKEKKITTAATTAAIGITPREVTTPFQVHRVSANTEKPRQR
jgi:hypothetical protein